MADNFKPASSLDENQSKRPRGRPRKSVQVGNASDDLLRAAETLFAERGFYGVTTRQVAAAAGADDALIYYHFGSKRELFDAVFARRAGTLNEVRRSSLQAYVNSSGKMTVEGAIAAFINPMIDLSQSADIGWKSYFTLVAQIDNTPWGGETIHRFFDPVVHDLIDVLKTILPECEATEIFWAYNFLAGSMMLALSETERVDRLSDGLCHARDLDAVRHRLVRYCAGGVLAMLGSTADGARQAA
ncbi:TetR/AcrR family transcriptional regulator [Sphingomonas sp. UYP23]